MDTLQTELDAIVGENRLKVRLIHDDTQVCVNAHERELLQTIQELQRTSFDRHWHIKENLFNKALIIPVDQWDDRPGPNFNGFIPVYKKFYAERIQMIIRKYDARSLSEDQQVLYKEAKRRFYALDTDDMAQYKEVRDMFERIRDL